MFASIEPFSGSVSNCKCPVTVHQSVAQNPYYFRRPTGSFAPVAAHAFIYHLFANHKASVDGTFDRATLKSFFSLTGGPDSSSLVYTPGHKRIPKNWYKRPVGLEYNVARASVDLAAIAAAHLDSIVLGRNTGTVNSFVRLNIANLMVRPASLPPL